MMENNVQELAMNPSAGAESEFSSRSEVPERDEGPKPSTLFSTSIYSEIELVENGAPDISSVETLSRRNCHTCPPDSPFNVHFETTSLPHHLGTKHLEILQLPNMSRRDRGSLTLPEAELPAGGDDDFENDDEEWQPWTYHYGSLLWVQEGQLQMARAFVNGIMDLGQVVFSPIAVVLYVLSTYYVSQPSWLTNYQWLLSIYFAVDYSLRVVITVHPWRYVLTVTGFFDLLSFVPFFIDRRWNLHFMKLYSVLHLKSLKTLLSESSSIRGWLEARAGYVPEAKASVATLKYQLFVTFVSIVFITACLIRIVESDYPPDDSECDLAKRADEADGTSEQLDACLSFHNSLYMIIVTISTVGYGDITPRTPAGRAFIAITILVSLIILPAQISRLVSLQGYGQNEVSFRPEGGHFVILTGSLTYSNISDFLSEVYHNSEYKGLRKMQVVLLGQGPESFELETLVRSYQGLVRYIPGSCRSPADMARVASRHRKCSAIFLVSSRAGPPEENDQLQVLRTLAVAANSNARVPIFTQVLMPQTRVLSSLQNVGSDITIACSDYIKLVLLARSCIIPGISTLMMAIFTSCDLSFLPRAAIGTPWLAEYQQGLQLKICLLEMSPCFVGHKYMDVAIFIYQRWGAILVGLDVKVHWEDRRCPALLPLGHITMADDMGLLLSPSLALTSRIAAYRCPNHERGCWGDGWWLLPARIRHLGITNKKRRRRNRGHDSTSPTAEQTQPAPCQAILDTVVAAAETGPNDARECPRGASRPASPAAPPGPRTSCDGPRSAPSPNPRHPPPDLFSSSVRRSPLQRMLTQTRTLLSHSTGSYSVRLNPVCSGELPGPQQVDGILAEVGLNKPNKFLFARLGGGEASMAERRLAASLARLQRLSLHTPGVPSQAPAASVSSTRVLNQSLWGGQAGAGNGQASARGGVMDGGVMGGGVTGGKGLGDRDSSEGASCRFASTGVLRGTGSTDRPVSETAGVNTSAIIHPVVNENNASQPHPQPQPQSLPQSGPQQPSQPQFQPQAHAQSPSQPQLTSREIGLPDLPVGGESGHSKPPVADRGQGLGYGTPPVAGQEQSHTRQHTGDYNMGSKQSLGQEQVHTNQQVGEDNNSHAKQLAAAVEAALQWPPKSVAVDRRVADAVVAHNEDKIREALASRTLTVCSLSGHVVITCPVAYPDIFYVVAQLRLRRPPTKPVLLLAPEEPTATAWGSIGVFEDVFFMKGTPRARLDLIRAGVHNADKVVVLADPTTTQFPQASDPSFTQEADAFSSDVANVETVATIESLVAAHRVATGTATLPTGTTALASSRATFPAGSVGFPSGNATFLPAPHAGSASFPAVSANLPASNATVVAVQGTGAGVGDPGITATTTVGGRRTVGTSQLAGGAGGGGVAAAGVGRTGETAEPDVVGPSNVIVEMHGLPEVCLLRPFHDARDKKYTTMLSQNTLRKAILSPAFAEGKVLSTAMLDTFFYRNFDVPVSNALLHAFVVGSEPEKGADARTAGKVCFLDQRPVPSEFVGREYNQLVRFLIINASMLCLGLYRPRGHNSAPAPYVVVNPDPASVLVKADLVYVLRWY